MSYQKFEKLLTISPSRLSIRIFSPKVVGEDAFGRSESRASYFSGVTLNLDSSLELKNPTKRVLLSSRSRSRLIPIENLSTDINRNNIELFESPISSLPFTSNKKRAPDRMELIDKNIISKSMDNPHEDKMIYFNFNDDADTLTIDALTESGCTSRFSQFAELASPRESTTAICMQATSCIRQQFNGITCPNTNNLYIQSKKQNLQTRCLVPRNCKTNSQVNNFSNSKLRVTSCKNNKKEVNLKKIIEPKPVLDIQKEKSTDKLNSSEVLEANTSDEQLDKLDTINESLREMNYTTVNNLPKTQDPFKPIPLEEQKEEKKINNKMVPRKVTKTQKKQIPQETKIVKKSLIKELKTPKQNELNLNLFTPVASNNEKQNRQSVSRIVPKILLSSVPKNRNEKCPSLQQAFKARSNSNVNKEKVESKTIEPQLLLSTEKSYEISNIKPLSAKICLESPKVPEKKALELPHKLPIENPFSKPLKRVDPESQPIIYDMFGNAQHPYESVITSLNENKPEEKPLIMRKPSANKSAKLKKTSAKKNRQSKVSKQSQKILVSKNEIKLGEENDDTIYQNTIGFKASNLVFVNNSSPTESLADFDYDEDFIRNNDGSDSSLNESILSEKEVNSAEIPVQSEINIAETIKELPKDSYSQFETSTNTPQSNKDSVKSKIREIHTLVSKNDSLKSNKSILNEKKSEENDMNTEYYNHSNAKNIYEIPPVLSSLINTLKINEKLTDLSKIKNIQQSNLSLDSNGSEKVHSLNSDYTLSTNTSKKSSNSEEDNIESETTARRQFSVVGGFGDEFPHRWRRGEVLGKGAFGIVYSAFLVSLGSIIAVKQVEMDKEDPDESLKEYNSLKEEINILKGLDHINIVKFLGTSLTGNIVNIFMENISGGTIEKVLKEYGTFEESLLKNFTTQIVEGINYLHQNKVIHRDIKGRNIMLMNNGVIKLIDFGCAKRLKKNQSYSKNTKVLKSFKGTIGYMAPEVIKETGHSFKADIWSLGATVFEMATGKPPWFDFAPYAAVFAIGNDSTPIPNIPDTFSEDARDFVKCCLNRDQDARPSASDLLNHKFLKIDV